MTANQKSGVDIIYEAIRERICLGVYDNGDVLYEGELGKEFEVSRTPIRQVLQRLAYEKLAVVKVGVGTTVQTQSLDEQRQGLQIRAGVYRIIHDLDLAATPPDMEAAVGPLYYRVSRLSGGPEREKFWSILRDVHQLTVSLTGDDVLARTDDMLFYRTVPGLVRQASRFPDLANSLIRTEFERLVDPIEKGDLRGFFKLRAETLLSYDELLSATD
ncbi:GntR family transcriptional regulator [Thalassospira sp. MA62]|nr:GntR family transcriptional regulator [Thalassospira sp. MA62]